MLPYDNSVALVRWIVLLAFVGLSTSLSVAGTVAIAAKPRKAVIWPGEPLVVDVQIANRSLEPATVDLGYDRIGAFWFTIQDGQGQSIATSSKIFQAGAAQSGRLEIEPETSTRIPLVMNRWCSTMLPAGEYTAAVHWETVAVGELQVKGREAFHLTVAPPHEAKLAALLKQLVNDGLDLNNPARRLSIQMLLTSDAPAAAGAIKELVAGLRRVEMSWYGISAVEALGRIGTVESVQVLTEIALGRQGGDDDQMSMRAVAMIYQTFDKAADKPAVRKACEQVMRVRPRPAISGPPID